MKKHILLAICLFFYVFFSFSCQNSNNTTTEELIHETADSFATHYFTWHFDRAMRFGDDDMKRYISFIASNVHGADLDLLLSTDKVPDISVGDITLTNDSLATAVINMTDVILMDTLGEEAHLHPTAQRTLTLRKASETVWQVTGIE